MTSCPMIRQRTDLIKYWSKLWRVVSEEGVHLCVTQGWTSAMYDDRLRLRLPNGVLPYIENVDEFLMLTQSHRRKGTKRLIFEKINKFCTSQTTEIKQVKHTATLKYNYSSSQTVEFHPLLPASRDHSTLQP